MCTHILWEAPHKPATSTTLKSNQGTHSSKTRTNAPLLHNILLLRRISVERGKIFPLFLCNPMQDEFSWAQHLMKTTTVSFKLAANDVRYSPSLCVWSKCISNEIDVVEQSQEIGFEKINKFYWKYLNFRPNLCHKKSLLCNFERIACRSREGCGL